MLRYTARNGTTFHFDTAAANCVQLISPDQDGSPLPVDLEDLREFMQYLDDQLEGQEDAQSDADAAAVSSD